MLLIVIAVIAANNKGSNKIKQPTTKVTATNKGKVKQTKTIDPQKEIRMLNKIIEKRPKDVFYT